MAAALVALGACARSDAALAPPDAGAPPASAGLAPASSALEVASAPAGGASAEPPAAGSTGARSAAPRRRIPEALLAALRPAPYVEQTCEDAPLDAALGVGPLVARRCAYETLGRRATVVVLDPPGEQVARWLVDATAEIPQLARLAATDRAAWEEALLDLGLFVVRQSSKVFPVAGDVVEDLGKGPRAFPFDRGVAIPCTRGCHCRVNSITPRAWCTYRASQGDDERACREAFSGPAGEERWRARCLATHAHALSSGEHPHFRAMLWWMGAFVDAACPRGAKEPCAGADVRDALAEATRAWRSGDPRPAPRKVLAKTPASP